MKCECQIKTVYLPSHGVRSYFALPNHGEITIFDVKVATNPSLKDKWWSLAYKRRPQKQTWLVDISAPPNTANFDHLSFQVRTFRIKLLLLYSVMTSRVSQILRGFL